MSDINNTNMSCNAALLQVQMDGEILLTFRISENSIIVKYL